MAEYGVRDLAAAMVAERRWHDAAPDLRLYRSAKLTVLQRALGAEAPADVPGLGGIGGLAPRRLIDDRSPFAGFLEVPREVAVIANVLGCKSSFNDGSRSRKLPQLRPSGRTPR